MIQDTQVSAVAGARRATTPISMTVLILMAFIPLAMGVALAFDTYRQYQAILLKTQDTANAVRDDALQQTTQFLLQSRSLLSKLSVDSKGLARLAERCPEVLAELTRSQPIYSGLSVLDGGGHVLCDAKARTQGLTPGPDVAADFSQLARNSQFSIGKPVRSSSSERWIARLLYPVKDSAGRLVGAIFLSIDLLNLDMTGPSANMPLKSLVGIINGDGTLVARSEGGLLRIGQIASSDAAKTVLRQREGTVRGVDFLGSDRLFSFAPIPDSDWILFASVDLEHAVAPFMQLLLERLAVFVVLMLASVGVLVIWRRRTTRPSAG